MAAFVTFESVEKAIRELNGRGINTTYEAILEAIGGGSKKTLSKILPEVEAKLRGQKTTLVPTAIIEAIAKEFSTQQEAVHNYLTKEIDYKSETIAQLVDEIDQLSELLTDERGKNEELTQKYKGLEERQKISQEQMEILQNDIVHANATAESARTSVREFEVRKEIAETAAKDAEAQRNNVLTERNNLLGELEASRKNLEKARSDLAVAHTEMESLKSQLVEIRKTLREQTKKTNGSDTSMAERVRKLEAELEQQQSSSSEFSKMVMEYLLTNSQKDINKSEGELAADEKTADMFD